jgi:hypothetical protein
LAWWHIPEISAKWRKKLKIYPGLYKESEAMPGWAWWRTHSGGRGRQISEFEASLVYRVSSRTARATQRNPVSKNQKPKNKTKKYVLEVEQHTSV